MPNPLGKVIPQCTGRQFAVGDIHGCINTFKALLDQLSLKPEDHLILLGDYVNKGPASKAVLDHIIELEQKYAVFPLLGNHDLQVLEFLNDTRPLLKEDLLSANTGDLVNLSPTDRKPYIEFLESLHYYFILDDYLAAHAGFNFNLANPFLGKKEILNIRDFFYDPSKAQNKTVIHGHNPLPLSEIQEQIDTHNKTINLDNGCVYTDREGQGNLLAMDLASLDLVIQPNID